MSQPGVFSKFHLIYIDVYSDFPSLRYHVRVEFEVPRFDIFKFSDLTNFLKNFTKKMLSFIVFPQKFLTTSIVNVRRNSTKSELTSKNY